MTEYFREPKKVRTRTELVKSCRLLRERNLELSQSLKEVREQLQTLIDMHGSGDRQGIIETLEALYLEQKP